MFFPNLNIPIAGLKKYHHNLSTPHITTCNFGQPAPVYYRHMMLGDKISVDTRFTIRTQPLALPTYGTVYTKLHAFFVPYRIVYSQYSKFLEGQQSYGSNPALPSLSSYDLFELFTTLLCAGSKAIADASPNEFLAYDTGDDFRTYTDVSAPPDQSVYQNTGIPFDFCVITNSKAFWHNVRLTRLGRYWLRIFNSLGYSWNWHPEPNLHVNLEMVSLAAWFKAYLDYFVPSQYQNSHPIQKFLFNIERNTTGNLQQVLAEIVQTLPCAYDADYFTSCWAAFDKQLPEGNLDANPFRGVYISQMGRPTEDNILNEEQITDNPDVGAAIENVTENTSLTAFGLRVLRAVDNYLTRNNWAGSRATERMLARFGIKVPEYRYNYTTYIGSDAYEFNISDVTNLTESQDYDLGSYAGKMWTQGLSKKFVYEADEPGMFFIFHAIMPSVDYFQGLDRLHLCLDRFDYYTPEFDQIGNDAVPVAELFNDFQLATDTPVSQEDAINQFLQGDTPNAPQQVFGFLPRYTHFKVPRGWLTGAYRVPSLRREIDAFNLYRRIDPSHSLRAQGNFLYMDSEDYDKIFSVDENLSDKFFPSFYFNVDLESKMISVSDSIPLDGTGEAPAGSNGAILN